MQDIPEDQLPDSLYHYTNSAGLLGILDTNSLYATHAVYLNDSQEFTHGMGLLLEEVKKWKKGLSKEDRSSWEGVLPDCLINSGRSLTAFSFEKRFEQIAKFVPRKFGPFVACLSEEEDQLSQWRGYGRGGGYSIRFNTRELLNSIRDNRASVVAELADTAAEHGGLPLGKVQFMKVNYTSEAPSDLKERLNAFMEELGPRLKARAQTPADRTRSEVVEPMVNSLITSAMQMKNPGFEEEKEYRIATLCKPPKAYSASEIGLVPRVELFFEPSCVKEIWIGPGLHMEARESSVQYYLDTKEIEKTRQQKYPGVKVTPSETPYRGD